MKRKILKSIVVAMVCTLVLFACKKQYIDDIFVTGVTLNLSVSTLEIGGTLELIPTIEPEDADDLTVNWTSSNSTVATVNNNGIVTAISPGTATITVTTQDGEFTANCVVTVAFATITLNKTTLTMQVSTTETLTATVLPASASNKTKTWSSSNPSVASVTSNGTVTAHQIGSAVISVTTADTNQPATCNVTVSTVSVELNESTKTMNKGTTFQLTATVYPENAPNRDVTWTNVTNNPTVATVNSNGVVTAIGDGTATIRATSQQDKTKFKECVITVIVPVTGITPLDNKQTLSVNDIITLTATVIPADATNKTIKWSSSDNTIVDVNNGTITAKSVGTATISAITEDGGFNTICIVTVNSLNVTHIILDNHTLTLLGSSPGQLAAQVYPINPLIDRTLNWTSQFDTVAVVSPTGLITPVPPPIDLTATPPAVLIKTDRKTKIYATSVSDPTIKDSCEVTIKYVDLVGLTLPATYQLTDTEKITPDFNPTNASIKNVTWDRSNTNVAFSTNGSWVPMVSGTANITAKSLVDPTIISNICVVTVP